jgi:hypothetical protein
MSFLLLALKAIPTGIGLGTGFALARRLEESVSQWLTLKLATMPKTLNQAVTILNGQLQEVIEGCKSAGSKYQIQVL